MSLPVHDDPLSVPMLIASGALIAVGCFCILELVVTFGTTFRQRGGLYFWSLLAATIATLFFF